jgi:MinD-like ATPase involved in chromosome partitioning or flagellar assembly
LTGPRRRSVAALASTAFRGVELVGRGHWRPPQLDKPGGRIITVASAGEGDGKSTVAVNLAVAMANLGAHVVLIDLDLQASSLHRMFGIDRPAAGLQALLDHQIDNLEMALTLTPVRNLHLIAGGPPVELDRERRALLMRQIRALDGGIVILDVGSRQRRERVDFFSLGALRLLVTAPGQPALERAYRFLEEAATRLAGAAPPVGVAEELLRRFGGRLVGNQAHGREEIETLHAFSRLVGVFLGISLPVIACLRASRRIAEATAAGRPLLLAGGLDENVRAFHEMAELLLQDEAPPAAEREPAEDTGLAGVADHKPLPSSLDPFRRKHPRHEVDWVAILRSGGREIAVRVLDISMGGAALQVVSELRGGDPGLLIFEQLPGRPAAPVMVRSRRESIGRAGVAFVDAGNLPAQLVAAAEAEHRVHHPSLVPANQR